jgi:universal stress protein A
MEWTISRILAGIEAGDRSEPAREVAMDLAEAFDAKLELLHAVEVRGPMRGTGRSAHWAAAAAEALAHGRGEVEAWLDQVVEHSHFADMPIEDYLSVVPGRAAQALLDRAEEWPADLIVFGPHRKRGFLDLGGTARAVLGHSNVPLWMQPEPPAPIHRVLVPLDLSTSSQEVMLAAATVADALGAKVTCLHVFSPPIITAGVMLPGSEIAPTTPYAVGVHREEEFAAFRDAVAGFDWGAVDVETLEADGVAEDEINARIGDFDLVAMGTHGHTGLARVLGSVADSVLKRSRKPVLCVPQETRLLTLES